MNRNVKRAECSAKNFFRGCMLLILKKITFFTVKDQFEGLYKNYYYTWVSTNNNWKKGTYTLMVIAENKSAKGGAETVGTCRVRLY